MIPENKLEQKVADYAELARDNKEVDVAALMINALQTEDQNMLSSKAKHWGYLISIGAPPLGLLYAIWFYFSDKSDGKRAAWMCVILTAISIAAFFLMMKVFFSSAGVSVNQIQQIKPADIYQLSQ